MTHQAPRPKLLALAVAALFSGLPAVALAVPQTFGSITLDAEYILGASSGTRVDGMTDASATIYTPGNGADLYLYKNDASNDVFFHTYGFTGPSTYFGARASGAGNFLATTRSTYTGTFTNTSSVAQVFNFSFNVAGGDLGITGSGEGSADLLLSIKKNGTDVARDHTTITQTALGAVSCASDDLGVLGSYMDCATATSSSASDGGAPFSIDLGLIGAGESFTLDYDIIATVSGNLSNGTGTQTVCDNGYGAAATSFYGGYGGGNCHEESYTIPGTAIARSGDPFDGGFVDPNSGLVPANFSVSVPEPAGIALIGLALVGLGATQRRRQDKG